MTGDAIRLNPVSEPGNQAVLHCKWEVNRVADILAKSAINVSELEMVKRLRCQIEAYGLCRLDSDGVPSFRAAR